ncbi:MAG: hypothetical protein ABID38_02930 [Candidatus Diapherotrites archaeon]
MKIVDAAHLDHWLAGPKEKIAKDDQRELNRRASKSSNKIRRSKVKFRRVMAKIYAELDYLENRLYDAQKYYPQKTKDKKTKNEIISDLEEKISLLKGYANFLDHVLNK